MKRVKANSKSDLTCAPKQTRHPANDNPLRIALVGCGPRGLYCLDALCRALELHESETLTSDSISASTGEQKRLHMTIFEPARHPGAGAVYALDQPCYLRMNFATHLIDAWIDDEHRSSDQHNLASWLAANEPPYADPEGYAPRPIVGKYLHDCFRRVHRRLSRFADVTLCREKVLDVQPLGRRWRVESPNVCVVADEVVFTVGHEAWRAGRPWRERRIVSGRRMGDAASTPTIRPLSQLPNSPTLGCVAHVFPVQEQLSSERIPSRCNVAVRGFGLTWIDAALAMTEGRGGRFVPEGDGLRYLASGEEPQVIFPFSRTGRPVLAKPIRSSIAVPPNVARIWAAGRASLRNVPRPACRYVLRNFIWPAVLGAAQRALDEMVPGQDVSQWWHQWRRRSFSAEQTLHAMQQSIAVAQGRLPPTPEWALAEAWRHLYATLIQTISHGGLKDDAWESFQSLAAEMERIAYGPPAENLARIVALIEAQIVDLRHVASSTERLLEEQGIDVVINAVLPKPTDLAPQGPLAKLLNRDTLRPMNRFTGIEVDRAGRPRSKSGQLIRNLAVFGRNTEGCVLGNDTLSRRLHPHIENWAAQTVAMLESNYVNHDRRSSNHWATQVLSRPHAT